uniref:Synaptotagmin-2 n=1 Tax=Cryptocotyle lingua TaxID=66766 RepID=A0A7U0YEH9_9TREM|nr:synaptotagmin-2 [Cryptocotyle lingua]
MPTAEEVKAANPEHLSNNTFLVNLALTFNVTSIPLGIFILILVCIACVLFVVLVIFIVRSCIRRKFIPKSKRRAVKSIYLDEIPGAVPGQVEGQYGTLEYSFEYQLQKQEFKVGVIQANDLQARPGMEQLDPYASVSLFKQRGEKMKLSGKINKTIVRKNTKSPNWQQSFSYSIPESELKSTVVVFEVFDYDSIGQDTCIGHLEVPLKDVDEGDYAGQISERTGWLKSGEQLIDGIGELCIGLCCNNKRSQVDVTIYEARQLKVSDQLSTKRGTGVFVHLTMRQKKKKLGSFDSKAKTELLNPYFNERHSFHVKQGDLDDCMLICKLKASTGRKKTLGYAVLGTEATSSTGAKQWEEMIKGPGKTHVFWHILTVGNEDS